MKFHAMTLCAAAALLTSAAFAQDTHRMHNDRVDGVRAASNETVDHSSWPLVKPFKTDGYRDRRFTQEFPNYKENAWAYGPVADMPDRMVFYPDLPSLSEVAAKIEDIHRHNAAEASEVRALANRARALGWNNIAAVYDQIASDHMRGATMASNWLLENNFTIPAGPSTVTVADNLSESEVAGSIDRLIDMHVKSYNDTTDKLHNEKSSTVRGMYLMQLTTIQRHLNLLRLLDRDVDRGRRDLSARLQSELDTTRTARGINEWNDMIFQEEWEIISTTYPTTVAQTPYVVPPDTEIRIVEKPIIVERVVERPVPVEQPAAQPAPVFTAPPTTVQAETIQPAPKTSVAGRRQTRVRPRRPAK